MFLGDPLNSQLCYMKQESVHGLDKSLTIVLPDCFGVSCTGGRNFKKFLISREADLLPVFSSVVERGDEEKEVSRTSVSSVAPRISSV